MYKIIGADQKEYGPVTIDQIRQWITESRVNAQTRARAEGDEAWRALSTFPEFADLLGATAETPPTPSAEAPVSVDGRQAALQAVKGPAIALIVTSIVNLVFGVWQLARLAWFSNVDLYSRMPQLNDPQIQKIIHLLYGPVGIASSVFELLVSVLILIGALKMQALRNYPLALTAAILAAVPCLTPCCFLGLPFGIWALVVLNKSGIKSQFS